MKVSDFGCFAPHCDYISAGRKCARRIQNPNLLIRSQMLYPLSYGRLPLCSCWWLTSQPQRRRDLNLRSPFRGQLISSESHSATLARLLNRRSMSVDTSATVDGKSSTESQLGRVTPPSDSAPELVECRPRTRRAAQCRGHQTGEQRDGCMDRRPVSGTRSPPGRRPSTGIRTTATSAQDALARHVGWRFHAGTHRRGMRVGQSVSAADPGSRRRWATR